MFNVCDTLFLFAVEVGDEQESEESGDEEGEEEGTESDLVRPTQHLYSRYLHQSIKSHLIPPLLTEDTREVSTVKYSVILK